MKRLVNIEGKYVSHHSTDINENYKMNCDNTAKKNVDHSFTLHGLEGEDAICLARSQPITR